MWWWCRCEGQWVGDPCRMCGVSGRRRAGSTVRNGWGWEGVLMSGRSGYWWDVGVGNSLLRPYGMVVDGKGWSCLGAAGIGGM